MSISTLRTLVNVGAVAIDEADTDHLYAEDYERLKVAVVRATIIAEAAATVGSPRTLTQAESGIEFSTAGAVAKVGFVLPASPAAGTLFMFSNETAFGVRIVPGAGATIKIADGAATANGIDSTDDGASICLRYRGAQWRQHFIGGGDWSNV